MRPEIRKYLSVSQYLQDYYSFRKSVEKTFSYDKWAQELGVSDKAYMRMLVLGKRPLNEVVLESFVENLHLSPDDQMYFKILTYYSQSKSAEQKDVFGKKLMSLLRDDLEQVEVKAHYEFLSNPLLPRLQIMLGFDDLDQSPQNLSWLLNTSKEEIQQGIEMLEKMDLIELSNGIYRPLNRSFKVGDSFGDLGLNAFYVKNLEDAQKAIQLPSHERRYKSVFLPLNQEEFEQFIVNLQKFTREQLSQFKSDEYRGRRLFQAHFNIFPVSLSGSDEKDKPQGTFERSSESPSSC